MHSVLVSRIYFAQILGKMGNWLLLVLFFWCSDR